ncbi:catecholate siderophore receptor Fiu [Ideonella livida]|uniref:Catecholate siderophore receptor Fiu n=1 Tax=Ideonella livida TaxID=2707176 RepID=A0A7C9TNV5_9BURK|nr:catecholate siderophore receptor Fiu [Ideonella livida]NDY93985.1 catecholate siderophore receptor Fiu [Ideonella livida]
MSSFIRSRAHGAQRPHAVSLAVAALASALPLGAAAQSAPTAPAATATAAEGTLPTVSVKAQREVPNKADVSASPKLSQPLVDTPKTVQVIKKETLREQGAATLMEALRNTPGITMQLGEGGSTAAGDTFQMRGFSASTSTFVDGIRDLGAVTRDTFNVEQVEVVKGPSGAEIGRGASAGYINLISKLPELDNSGEASLTLGTASKKRATLDLNRTLGEHSALRLNLMTQNSGVDGRDEVRNKGTGIAPSIAFGLNTPTRVFLYSQHLRQDNVPDGGIPSIGLEGYVRSVATGVSQAQVDAMNAAPAVRSSNYYGSPDDYEKVDADMFSVRLEHDLAPGTTVRSLSRYGKTHMDRVLTSVGAVTATTASDPSTWTVARSRQRTDQTNEILANQTSLSTAFTTGGLRHDLVGGVELMLERQTTLGTGTAAQTVNGVSYTAISNPAANLYHPSTSDVLGVPYLTGLDTYGDTMTVAAYVFDTLTLNDQWKVSAGLRQERYRTHTTSNTLVTTTNQSTTYPAYAVGSVAPNDLRDTGELTSWNLGVVFKPAANGSVYAALANAATPPGSANFALSATTTSASHAAMDPQRTKLAELGTKWDLLDKQLNVSATAYRSVNTGQVTQNPVDQTYVQEGQTTVKGLELAAVGQLNSFWQVSAAVAKMKTTQEHQQSVSSTTGAVTTTTGVRWSPELTASVWTSYTLGDYTLGGGVRHVGEQKRAISKTAGTTTPDNMAAIAAYQVVDLMAAWKVNKALNLQLNVGNVLDEDYIASLNNNGSRVKLGAPRSAQLTAHLSF